MGLENMDFDKYQEACKTTAIYPKGLTGLCYLLLNYASEAGEACGILAKAIRDNNGLLTEEQLDRMVKELGDGLWQIAMTAEELGYDLSEIAVENITKLKDRKERGKLQGSGDYR